MWSLQRVDSPRGPKGHQPGPVTPGNVDLCRVMEDDACQGRGLQGVGCDLATLLKSRSPVIPQCANLWGDTCYPSFHLSTTAPHIPVANTEPMNLQ